MEKSYNLDYQRKLRLKDNGNGIYTPHVVIQNTVFENPLIENDTIEVGAGSTYTSAVLTGEFRNLGVALQVRELAEVKITVAYYEKQKLRLLFSEDLFTSTSRDHYGGGLTEKITNNYSILVKNLGNSPINLRELIVTEFA